MLRVLLVEDTEQKSEFIKTVIKQHTDADDYSIDVADDFITAKKCLLDVQYDIAIVDVQIPMRKGEGLDSIGGVKLIREIDGNIRIKRPRYIVGMSEFEQSISEVTADFSERVFGLIHYSRDSLVWKSQLAYTLKHARRSIASLRAETAPGAIVQTAILVVCALATPELEAVLKLPLNWVESVDEANCIVTYEAKISSPSGEHNIIAAAALEAGMAATAALCGKLIHVYRPQFICMTGIAGGMKAETNFGDVVFADFVWDYTNGKFAKEKGRIVFLPEPKVIDADALVKSQFLRLSQNSVLLKEIQTNWTGIEVKTDLKLVFGPMFCGTSVVAHENVTKDLRGMNRKLKGIDMESYSVFAAAKYAGKPEPIPIVIKGISDHADAKKGDAWHGYAAYTSATLLYEWAKRFL